MLSKSPEPRNAIVSTSASTSTSTSGAKDNARRKVRSCDVCRKRKVRCDGEPATGGRCTTCNAIDAECTYVIAGKPRPLTFSTRVKQLQEREKRLEKLLQNFLPGVDLSRDNELDRLAAQVRPRELPSSRHGREGSEHLSVQTDSEGYLPLVLENGQSFPAFLPGHFRGKSSPALLVESLLEWKLYEQGGGEVDDPKLEGRENLRDLLVSRGHEERPILAWEEGTISHPAVQSVDCSFPEEDLMTSLIDLYFDYVNVFMPLLHRPTFDYLLRANTHIKDVSFSAVLLLVCAIGARFSYDQRAFLDGATLSAGYAWFKQAQELDDRVLAPASLYSIQALCLRAEFLRGADPSEGAWVSIGIGLRRAQDVGAHRWQTFGDEISAERELWTRAWWCLVVLDRVTSTVLGRPCITDGWDSDVGLPTECDDEFWDHPDPEKNWKQPDGVPSKISFFISHIKQTTLLARAQRILYPLDKTRRAYMLLDIFPDFDRRVVQDLNAAVNQWVDSIPDHLRNPHTQRDSTFHRQSIVLHADLYFLQIFMHRPFLKTPEKATPMTASSITVCTNAARACSRLLDTLDESCKNAIYRIQWAILSSTVVLLMSVWAGKRMGLQGFYAKEMHHIEKCLRMLKHSERCWQSSGKIVDLIRLFMDASDVSHPGRQSKGRSTQSTSNPLGAGTSAISAQRRDGREFTEIPATLPVHSELSSQPSPEAHAQSFSGTFPNNPPAFIPSEPQFNLFPDNLDPHSAPLFPPPPQEDFISYQPYGLADSSNPVDPFLGLEPGLMPDMFDPDALAVWNSAPLTYFGDWDTFVDNINEVQMSSDMGSMNMG